ncbi:MAG: peptidoglycan-binding protein LysM [Pseudomonadota bacterium]|nr:peptidoglycan-binding protein LysM [Pseudomonadota bacterium]
MGLFDFASNIGNKLFGDDEKEGAEKIKEHIEEDNPGVEDLEVSLEDGVATLKGSARDQAAAEKAILMAGNVRGVQEVKADDLKAPPAAEAEQNVTFYEIQKGDTLWAIAKEHYGDGNKYNQIFDANREVIKNPDLIFPAQKIRMPPA